MLQSYYRGLEMQILLMVYEIYGECKHFNISSISYNRGIQTENKKSFDIYLKQIITFLTATVLPYFIIPIVSIQMQIILQLLN